MTITLTPTGAELCDCEFCQRHVHGIIRPPAPVPEPTEFDEEETMLRVYKAHNLRRLREIRESQGLSQTSLAILSGVTQQDISLLERGITCARGVTSTMLAVALGVSVEELEGGP